MGGKYVIATGRNGEHHEEHVTDGWVESRENRHRAQGRTPITLTEQERRQARDNAAWIAEQHRQGRI
ncbi:hypothetical protein [Micromonospora sp. NPDC023956]|uniref:hypothetical protein n=1 Tax=Micromonospora sp. NPDC023956 TaxID=3155722 RepID=UPI0033E5A928